MIRCIWSLLFETRLDRMTFAEINARADAEELTFAEVKRLAKLERYSQGLSR